MEKKIFKSLSLVGFLSVLITFFISVPIFYSLLVKQIKNDLYDTCLLIEGFSFDDLEQNNLLITSNIRITAIDLDGKVIYDSDYNNLGNHLNREEIVGAIENGDFYCIRESDTLNKITVNYAKFIQNEYIFRLSKEVNNSVDLILSFSGLFLFIMIFLFTLIFHGSKRLTKIIVNPIVEIEEQVSEETIKSPYPELDSLVKNIEKSNKSKNDLIIELENKTTELSLITENMNEGLVILDKQKNIVLVNKSARKFLYNSLNIKENFLNKNFLYLNHDAKLNLKIDQAINGESGKITLQIEKKIYNIYLNPVYGNTNKINGAIVLVLDITKTFEAEKIRRDFSANVTHELKTPLTIISGYSEIIENNLVKDTQDINKFAKLINKESNRMLNLVNDILNLSELENTDLIDKADFDIKELIESIVCSLDLKFKHKDIKLFVDVEKINVLANQGQIEQMFYNLIDNAIRYNKQGGEIYIESYWEYCKPCVKITDTGIGIPQKHHTRIFERFYRVDKSRSKSSGGTGLGLSLVKHIAKLNNVEITLESKDTEGTTFYIKFM